MPSRASVARYAKALFDVGLKESDPVRIERDLASFVELLSSHADLQSVLTNPAVPVNAKRPIVDALAVRLHAAPPAHKLLLLMADRDRLGAVPDLLAVYRERLMEHQQVVRAEVTTSEALPPGRLAQIQETLASLTGREVDLKTHIDPGIIGGVVTRIGSTVYDGSIATQLTKLRQRLIER